MIYAIVGAGGKTGLLKEMAARFRQEGKSVFATTTTHMFIEEDTLLTDDAALIIDALRKNGYVFAGVPEERIVCADEEMAGIDLVDIKNVESVYILYDTSTYNLSCQMKEKLLKRLEESK